MRSFGEAVRELERTDGDEDSMRAVVDLSDTASNEEILMLARVLASSGDQFESDSLAADIPSTGGPSSLSTLLCPLLLRAKGFRVPKIGVEGRPAGAIDVLGSIPGYRWDLNLSAAREILEQTGYVHLSARRFAPLDGQLFSFRKEVGAIDNPPLAIASLLSKKLAAGVTHVVLEVRVAPFGNFGGSFELARENAARFNQVACIAGLDTSCVLTDARQPFQPYIGRGEALVALHQVLAGTPDPWLSRHVQLCRDLTELVSIDMEPIRAVVPEIKIHFEMNLQAQGTSWQAFESRVGETSSAQRVDIDASKTGYLRTDLNGLRLLLTGEQQRFRYDEFPDPAGIEIVAQPEQIVQKGEVIARVRTTLRTRATERFAAVFSVGDEPYRIERSEVVSSH